MLGKGGAGLVAVGLVAEIGAGGAEDEAAAVGRQVLREVVQGRQQLTLHEIPRRPEYDEKVGVYRHRWFHGSVSECKKQGCGAQSGPVQAVSGQLLSVCRLRFDRLWLRAARY